MSGQTAEASMFSPAPRKAFTPPRTIPSPVSCVAIHELPQVERSLRYEWAEEDLELQDLLTGQLDEGAVLPGWHPASNVRRLSEASTSAGPSSGFEDSLSPVHFSETPSSPTRTSTPQADEKNLMETPSFSKLSTESPSSIEKVLHPQSRKLFVGGIPQNVDENELHNLFSRFGKVRRSWLQVFTGEQASDGKKHRGFGFVIFTDFQTVGKVLGEEFSKFVYFGDGLSVEVKRALGKKNASVAPESLNPTVVVRPCETQRGGASAVAPRHARPGTPISLAGAIANSSPSAVRQPTQANFQCCFNTWIAVPLVTPCPSSGVPSLVTPCPSVGVPSQVLAPQLAVTPTMRWQCQKNLELVLRQAMPDSYED